MVSYVIQHQYVIQRQSGMYCLFWTSKFMTTDTIKVCYDAWIYSTTFQGTVWNYVLDVTQMCIRSIHDWYFMDVI